MKSEQTQNVSSDSGSVTGLLGVAFIVLKLCGVINWPWLWVLAPFWIPFALVLVILIPIFLIAGYLNLSK